MWVCLSKGFYVLLYNLLLDYQMISLFQETPIRFTAFKERTNVKDPP